MSEREGIVKVLPPGEVGEVLEAEWWDTNTTNNEENDQEVEAEQEAEEETTEGKEKDKLLGRGWVALIVILVALAIGGFFFLAKSFSSKEEKKETPAPPAKTETHATLQTVKPVQELVQLPDCPTPCTIEIKKIHDLYTDGEPVYVLPPGWPEKDKILYSGHGHLVLSGGNIHSGQWKFWSTDPSKVVAIRAFEKR